MRASAISPQFTYPFEIATKYVTEKVPPTLEFRHGILYKQQVIPK
jgi:hypothetical protein